MGREGLIFDWSRPKLIGLRFLFFVLVSLGIHLFILYAFKVVYPTSDRYIPTTAELSILDWEDPSSRAVLMRLEDRLAIIEPKDEEEDVRVKIEKLTPRYKPSFADYKILLKEIPPFEENTDLPKLAEPGTGFMPPLKSLREKAEVIRKSEILPEVRPIGALADREILPEEIPWPVSVYEAVGGSRLLYRLGVEKNGRVRHCLLSDGVEANDTAAGEWRVDLDAAIRQIRFAPAPEQQAAVQWGWLEILW